MVVTLFIMGLPGSGKSAAFRYIEQFSEEYSWIVKRFGDYSVLFTMFLADKEPRRFRSTKYGGFDILDYTAFDEALEKLGHKIEQREKPADGSKELLIIEFARVGYYRALSFFPSYLLEDAYFLFIDADIEIRKQRIKERVMKPPEERTEDDNDVSEYILDTYYSKDQGRYLELVAPQIRKQFGIREKNIHVINNGANVPEDEFHKQVAAFAVNILRLNK
jgi:cytidylate kinase